MDNLSTRRESKRFSRTLLHDLLHCYYYYCYNIFYTLRGALFVQSIFVMRMMGSKISLHSAVGSGSSCLHTVSASASTYLLEECVIYITKLRETTPLQCLSSSAFPQDKLGGTPELPNYLSSPTLRRTRDSKQRLLQTMRTHLCIR
jgi:hypothetical protein